MSEYVSAEISLNVGELPNSPGLKVAARLGLGAENSGNIRTTFRDKTGRDLDDLTLYIVVPAKSQEGAQDIHDLIHRLIEKVTGEEKEDDERIIRNLREIVAKNDNDEFEGSPKFVFTPSIHNHSVILQVRPVEGFREMLSGQLEMVTGMAGDVLERKQEIYLEFDIGRTFGDVVHSSHAFVDLLESIAFKLWIHLHPQLFDDLVNLADNLGAPQIVSMFLGIAKLFSSANLNLNFKSAAELPDDLKQSFESINTRLHEKILQKNFPEGVKKFFKHFADNGSGNVHIFGGINNVALFLDLHLPGVSQFISE